MIIFKWLFIEHLACFFLPLPSTTPLKNLAVVSSLETRLLLNTKEVIESYSLELYIFVRKRFRHFKGRVIITRSAF